MNSKFFSCFIFILVAIVIYIKQTPFITDSNENLKCNFDILKNSSSCNLRCPYGKFALPGMTVCHDWLNCMDEIKIISTISISVVKSVYLAKWNEYEVAVSVLSSKVYEEDFKHNLFMLKSLTPSDKVVKLIGYCNYSVITKYHEFGSALNANYHLKYTLQGHDNMKTRLNLCVSYASVIHFLHSSPVGVRVMCDSSSLEKTLSQYLLTEKFEVVANDLDATPEVNSETKKGIICGKKILHGTFVAPEQKWPFSEEPFDVRKMIPYDEKTDIWKIPDVCNWFLGESSAADFIKYKLFSIHKQCKSLDPSKRPNSSHILDTYQKALIEL